MVQRLCCSHTACGTPQAEESVHQSKTGQHKWWEREIQKQSGPKHAPFPPPGLGVAPHLGVLPTDPTNHSPGLRWHPCLHEYLVQACDHCTSKRPVVPSHKHTRSKSPSRSLPFIRADAESIASPLLALPGSLSCPLRQSQNRLRHLNFILAA